MFDRKKQAFFGTTRKITDTKSIYFRFFRSFCVTFTIIHTIALIFNQIWGDAYSDFDIYSISLVGTALSTAYITWEKWYRSTKAS